MKKIIVILIMLVLSLSLVGCNEDIREEQNENIGEEKYVMTLSSYNPTKPSSSVIFEMDLKNEYKIDDNYDIIVRYGHLLNIQGNEISDNHLLLLQVHYIENLDNNLDFPTLISGERLLEISDFYTSKYSISCEIKNGIRENLVYNNELKTSLPKNLIKNLSGYLRISLICYSLDESGEIQSSNYDGSNIYISYKIENGKIYFLSK